MSPEGVSMVIGGDELYRHVSWRGSVVMGGD